MENHRNVVSMTMWQQLIGLREDCNKYTPDWKPVEFKDYQCQVYYADNGWLTDLIDRKQLTDKDHKAIFFSAQMGRGKTTMIFEKCLFIAKESHKKILYLCSRSALCHQIKTKAMEDEINKEMYAGDMFVKEIEENLTEAGVRARNDFGILTIMTYQHFVKNTHKINPEEYCFVIADEAHFITSDSPFNVTTYMAFELMIKMFRECHRIYLTATANECINCIYNLERKSTNEESLNITDIKWRNNSYLTPSATIMDFYVMKEDYRHIIPHFFMDDDEILEYINQNANQYWLIFVRDKFKGNSFKEKFENLGITTEFITAEIDKNNSLYNALLTKEQLPCQILISTKVLDVGINVQTENLGVVVFEEDVVTLKQMIGRKRLKPSELLHVYFKTPSLNELTRHRNKIIEALEEANKTKQLVDRHHMVDKVIPPFFYDGNNLNYNPCFFEKLNSDIRYYDQLIEEMEQNTDNQNIIYVKRMMENFPGAEWNEKTIFLVDKTASALDLLNGYVDRWFDKSEFDVLSGELIKILGDPRERPRDNPLNKININTLINPIGYQLISDHNPIDYTIKRLDNNE